jgi:hypothetical protein
MFQLTKGVVVDLATGFQPLDHELLLACVWVNPVGEVHYQHRAILPRLSGSGKLPIFKALSLLIGLGESMYPNAKLKIMAWELSLPQTPSLVKPDNVLSLTEVGGISVQFHHPFLFLAHQFD